MRALVYLEHSIQDARTDRSGNRRVVSRQVQFAEVTASGDVRGAGYAPYLDYRPPTESELALIRHMEEPGWLRNEIESRALDYAVRNLVPSHLQEVKCRKEQMVDKTMAAVKERLTTEISYWDHRAEQLKQQELAGKVNAKINSAKARQRADELTMRLQRRMEELQQERRISPLPPNVIGGALIVPAGLLMRLNGGQTATLQAKETKRVEMVAMRAVMAAEQGLGFEPRDVAADKCGYDIESRDPAGESRLRFIEVKGRVRGGHFNRHQERDSDRTQQAGSVHSGDCASQRRTGGGHHLCAGAVRPGTRLRRHQRELPVIGVAEQGRTATMTDAPPYFEDVRATAARRWVQLEQDPVLAGPWHQLFKQVQSPRHVVSELLQNADDAGATMASADIQDGEFIFIHNGEDFTEEHFISLCRFGYSNKRSLHTIGFRGIGFKSTFSLGDEVRLRTPSLSVAFRRSRFTEPLWMARTESRLLTRKFVLRFRTHTASEN